MHSQKCSSNISYSRRTFENAWKLRCEYPIFAPHFWECMKTAALISHIRPIVFIHSQKCGANMGYSPRGFRVFTKVQREYGIFTLQFSCILKSGARIWDIRAALLRMHGNCGSNIPYSRRTFVNAWKLRREYEILGPHFWEFSKVRCEYEIFTPQFSWIHKSAAWIWDIHPAVFMHSQKCGPNISYSRHKMLTLTNIVPL